MSVTFPLNPSNVPFQPIAPMPLGATGTLAASQFSGPSLARDANLPWQLNAGIKFQDQYDSSPGVFVDVPFKSNATGDELWFPFQLNEQGKGVYTGPAGLPPYASISGVTWSNVADKEGVAFGALTNHGLLWAQDAGGNTFLPGTNKTPPPVPALPFPDPVIDAG